MRARLRGLSRFLAVLFRFGACRVLFVSSRAPLVCAHEMSRRASRVVRDRFVAAVHVLRFIIAANADGEQHSSRASGSCGRQRRRSSGSRASH